MSTLKTFLMYFVWILAFFIFSQIMIYISINTTYKYKDVIAENSIIKEAQVQATSINGFAKCKILNDTNNVIENKYIKIECYSKNNILMGTKYIEIDKMQTNEEREFEVRFNYSRVQTAKINVIDEIPEEATNEEKISDQQMNIAMVISALILLIYFG